MNKEDIMLAYTYIEHGKFELIEKPPGAINAERSSYNHHAASYTFPRKLNYNKSADGLQDTDCYFYTHSYIYLQKE